MADYSAINQRKPEVERTIVLYLRFREGKGPNRKVYAIARQIQLATGFKLRDIQKYLREDQP
jgi:hypothetical protein